MKTYIALLRGINVSGQKKMRMAELRDHLSGLGFQNVRTYIQSGNIVFEHSEKANKILEDTIIDLIKSAYGFDVPVLVRQAADLRTALKRNPFTKDASNDLSKIAFAFLSEMPDTALVKKLEAESFDSEHFIIDSKVIYLYIPNGFGRAKLNNNFLERKLKVAATSRNLKTVQTLLEMAGSSD